GGFTVNHDEHDGSYQVFRRVNGRVLISNYDPAGLSDEERTRVHDEAEAGSLNDILVDVRPDHPGGEYPLHGRLRLRSFHAILTFLGRGIQEEREYDVAPDPRTPQISENPPYTLDIIEAKTLPPDVDVSVELKGYHYALRPDAR